MLLPKLYPITDGRLSGLSHAEQVACLCDGGARFVQLREKHLSPREFYQEAEEALLVARRRGWYATQWIRCLGAWSSEKLNLPLSSGFMAPTCLPPA